MTDSEYENLKVGDICVFKRGRDKNKKCSVLYIVDKTILVRAINNVEFDAVGTNRKIRLSGTHELDIVQY